VPRILPRAVRSSGVHPGGKSLSLTLRRTKMPLTIEIGSQKASIWKRLAYGTFDEVATGVELPASGGLIPRRFLPGARKASVRARSSTANSVNSDGHRLGATEARHAHQLLLRQDLRSATSWPGSKSVPAVARFSQFPMTATTRRRRRRGSVRRPARRASQGPFGRKKKPKAASGRHGPGSRPPARFSVGRAVGRLPGDACGPPRQGPGACSATRPADGRPTGPAVATAPPAPTPPPTRAADTPPAPERSPPPRPRRRPQSWSRRPT